MVFEKYIKYSAVLVFLASLYFIIIDLLEILSDRYTDFISHNWYFFVSALLSGYLLIKFRKKRS